MKKLSLLLWFALCPVLDARVFYVQIELYGDRVNPIESVILKRGDKVARMFSTDSTRLYFAHKSNLIRALGGADGIEIDVVLNNNHYEQENMELVSLGDVSKKTQKNIVVSSNLYRYGELVASANRELKSGNSALFYEKMLEAKRIIGKKDRSYTIKYTEGICKTLRKNPCGQTLDEIIENVVLGEEINERDLVNLSRIIESLAKHSSQDSIDLALEIIDEILEKGLFPKNGVGTVRDILVKNGEYKQALQLCNKVVTIISTQDKAPHIAWYSVYADALVRFFKEDDVSALVHYSNFESGISERMKLAKYSEKGILARYLSNVKGQFAL